MDFENMPCDEIWDFITADPPNGTLDVASAISVWNSKCAEENGGPWPASGGTWPPKPPPHV